ncbi:MAG TPA: acyl-CoA dehydrogenase family protein [Solirubrobacterales bacterium]|nr:acyl-CoA dehydrogenase family protein [Solirubrobacterales bacterium]
MDFSFNQDQQDLREAIRAFLDRHAGPAAVRVAIEDDDAFAREPWARLVGEMELTSLAIDLERGGAGAGFVEVGIALEELGRTLLPVPYLGTVAAAGAIADAEAAGAEAAPALAERIVAGAVAAVAIDEPAPEAAAAVAAGELRLDGVATHVLDGAHAELLVLAAELDGEPALLAVELNAEGVSVEPQKTLDQARGQATVRMAGAPAVRLSAPGDGGAAVARAGQRLAIAQALESVGAASRCLRVTVEYLKERVQFGRPIGSFQALKHRCADLAAELEAARSTAYYAGWAVDGAPEELPVLAPMARAVCGEALLRVAGESIQMHGGIGFTWEHDAHLYFKRAKASELLAGGFRAQRRLVGTRGGIVGASR